MLAGLALARSGLATGGPALCPTRMIFGIPCPACGLTRAASAVAHGDVTYATALNIAAVPLAVGALVLAIGLSYELATGRDALGALWSKPRFRGGVFVVVLALMAASWGMNLYRHVHGIGPLQLPSWHERHAHALSRGADARVTRVVAP